MMKPHSTTASSRPNNIGKFNKHNTTETVSFPSVQNSVFSSVAATTDFLGLPAEPLPQVIGRLSPQQQVAIFLQLQQNQQQIPSTLLADLCLKNFYQQEQAALHPYLGLPIAPTHNLIPSHLQGTNGVLATLNGTPGYPPALIPQSQLLQQHQHQQPFNSISSFPSLSGGVNFVPQQPIYTVQDRPMEQPVYNGVNPAYPGLRVLNTQPPIFCVDNFLMDYECDFLIQHAQDSFGPAPVVGKGAGEVSPSRTSSTCYLAREDLPDILRKVSFLTGKPMDHCELPQVGRYFPSQQYLQHYDAFDMSTDDGRRFAANGGQRTITVLVYLNTVARGGATRFPALNLDVKPVRGMALIFFPATVDGLLDKLALHAAMPAIDTKYVSQVWIRQSTYSGQPSKRLPQVLGVPFGHEHLCYQQQQQQQHQQADLLNLGQLQQQQHQAIFQPSQQANLLNLGNLQLPPQQQQQQHTISTMMQF